jgi:hypothetical protein
MRLTIGLVLMVMIPRAVILREPHTATSPGHESCIVHHFTPLSPQTNIITLHHGAFPIHNQQRPFEALTSLIVSDFRYQLTIFNMTKPFQDRVVLITGGASGIGYGAILKTSKLHIHIYYLN